MTYDVIKFLQGARASLHQRRAFNLSLCGRGWAFRSSNSRGAELRPARQLCWAASRTVASPQPGCVHGGSSMCIPVAASGTAGSGSGEPRTRAIELRNVLRLAASAAASLSACGAPAASPAASTDCLHSQEQPAHPAFARARTRAAEQAAARELTPGKNRGSQKKAASACVYLQEKLKRIIIPRIRCAVWIQARRTTGESVPLSTLPKLQKTYSGGRIGKPRPRSLTCLRLFFLADGPPGGTPASVAVKLEWLKEDLQGFRVLIRIRERARAWWSRA